MIRALGHLDTWTLAVTLYKYRNLFTGLGPVQEINITDDLSAKEWAPAKNAVGKALAGFKLKPHIVAVRLEKLLPKAHIAWNEGSECDFRIHIPVVTNPLAFLYAGAFSGTLPVGQVTLVSADTLNSASNLGESARYHLIIDCKNPEAVTEIVQ